MNDPDKPVEMDHPQGATGEPGSSSIVFVRFDGRGAAERMVASLGRGFRHLARSGKASAFVVTRKRDGSFKLVQSRVVTASSVVSAAIHVTVATLTGFIGMTSAIRGAKAVGHATRERQSGVGRDAERLAELFEKLDPHAAYAIFRCTDDQTAKTVVAQGNQRGSDNCSQYSQAKVLEQLDQLGSDYDWLRPAVDEPAPKASKQKGPAEDPPASTS